MKQGAAADTVTEANQPPFQPPSIEALGPLFPQFEILELLGKGGMGAVYKARQRQLDRFVALKILPPNVGHDPAFAERFAREARALARLNHPGIVTLYEFGQVQSSGIPSPPAVSATEEPKVENQAHAAFSPSLAPITPPLYYFLMEFVDGVSLGQLLNMGRISAREALAIVPQICDALQYAHDQGIVHRDIKPENILLDRRGRVKVADFGLAKLVGSEASGTPPSGEPDRLKRELQTLTEAGKIMGTPQYMAPEQREHPGEVDHRVDIYALGVVFYQMLTGELPGKKVEPPSSKVHIDVRLDEVVLRALESRPERRYQQVSALKTQVETIASIPGPAGAGFPQTTPLKPHSDWRKGMPLLSPFQSQEVREICGHLTKPESNLVSLLGFLFSLWIVVAVLGIPVLIKSFPTPGNWIVALLLVVVFVITLPMLSRIMRQYLCATAWAREHRLAPEHLRLFSLRGNNLWKAIVLLALGLMLVVVEHNATANSPGPSASTQRQPVRINPQQSGLEAGAGKSDFIGQALFPEGDFIQITSVQRSANRLAVKGRYYLVSRDQAQLALYVTVTNQAEAITDPSQELQISKGRGDFELVDKHLVPGLPHVSMYAGGKLFAALYFGTRDEAAKERSLDLGYAVHFGPVIEIVVEDSNWRKGYDLDTGQVVEYAGKEPFSKASLVVGRAKSGAAALYFVHSRAEWFPDGKVRWNMAAWIVPINLAIVPSDSDDYARSARMPKDPVHPETYEFRTQKGRMGVLQILSTNNNPRGVWIRYKLVQYSPAAQTSSSDSMVKTNSH